MKIYWAGDEDSFQLVLKAEAKLDSLRAQEGMTAGHIDDMLAELPPLWRHEGSTAVVEINGPVVQGEAGWMRLFGILGYDEIAKAAIEAASDPDTKAMLYHINSPGGDVSGIVDMSALLGQISAMKPSAVHTSELMASAGYWLASSIKEATITAGPTAIVGSIGVLQVHRENSQMLENMGVRTTVLRSGKYKAEVNSVEALSPEAKSRAEQQLADVHAIFRAQVGRGRPNLSAEDLAEVTEGQTFLGKRAVTAGLVDQVASFNLALKLLDKRKQSRDTSSNSKGKTMAIQLTPEQLAAIAAGAPMQSFGLNADGSTMSAEDISAYEAKVREDAAALAAANTADDAAKPETTDDGAGGQGAPPAAAEVQTESAVVALLKEQLAQANAEVLKLTVAATAHTDKSAEHAELLTIARAATANLLIPMGGSAAAVDGMDAKALIAEHSRAKALFLEKFKAGQVTKSAPAAPKAAALPFGFEFAVKQSKAA